MPKEKIEITLSEGFLYSDHHNGDVYISPYEEEDLYCETCGDSDYGIGEFSSQKEMRLAIIDYYLEKNPDKSDAQNLSVATKLVDDHYFFSDLQNCSNGTKGDEKR